MLKERRQDWEERLDVLGWQGGLSIAELFLRDNGDLLIHGVECLSLTWLLMRGLCFMNKVSSILQYLHPVLIYNIRQDACVVRNGPISLSNKQTLKWLDKTDEFSLSLKDSSAHYRNLIQVLDHGLKWKKVHRILTSKESNWMEKYIMLNTNLRTKAKNDFEKDFFKLKNNSVFGKNNGKY